MIQQLDQTTMPSTDPVKKTSSSDLDNWVPMPRYLLRTWLVKRFIRRLNPSSFIEIGAASGHMASWICNSLDICGTAVEISPEALRMLRQRLGNETRVRIFNQDSRHLDPSTHAAEMLLSMEVLEHIQNDTAALTNWFDLIRPGGHLVLSVPAHQRKFSAEDEMVGHFRRYDKNPLIEKLKKTGFENPRIYSYGFPLGLLLKQLRTRVASQSLQSDQRSRQERTEASGVERKRWLSFRWMLNDWFMLPFNLLQLPFLPFDWSDGYIAIARKPGN